MKTCYPQATVEAMSPGHTSNIVVLVDGKEVWNKKKGDSAVTTKSIGAVMEKVTRAVEAK